MSNSPTRSSWRRPPRHTLHTGLLHQADAQPDKVAVRFPGEDISYAEMWQRVTSIANGLTELGFKHGDFVAVMMRNSSDQLFIWFAASAIGAVYVPINTAYVGTYLQHPLDVVSARVLFVDEHLAASAQAVLPHVRSLAHLVVRGGDPSQYSRPGVQTHSMASFLAFDRDRLHTTQRPAWNDPNAVLFTAGTTGVSKGGLVTQNFLVRASEQFVEARGGTSDDVYFNPLPLFHGNAMMLGALGPLLSGATAAFEENFSVSRFWERVRYYGANQLTILGPLLLMLWKQPVRPDDADNPARVMVAVPVPPELHRPIEARFGVRIVVAYGLSECVPIALSTVDDPAPPGTSGRPNPRFEVRLFDEDDVEVAPGDIGEICCRPNEPNIMFEGYVKNAEATVAVWRNLWFHTGDLGRIDDNGYLSFVDRKKDYLRRRGENISSFEVERAILAHPDILETAVIGVASDLSEDEVMAYIVRREGAEFDARVILDHCVANMPYFAVPRYVELVDALPKNSVGRVEKFTLRQRGITADTFDREAAGYMVERRDKRV